MKWNLKRIQLKIEWKSLQRHEVLGRTFKANVGSNTGPGKEIVREDRNIDMDWKERLAKLDLVGIYQGKESRMHKKLKIEEKVVAYSKGGDENSRKQKTLLQC